MLAVASGAMNAWSDPATLDNPFGTRLSPSLRYDLLPMCPGWTFEGVAEREGLCANYFPYPNFAGVS